MRMFFYSSVKDGTTGDNNKKIRRSYKQYRLFDAQKYLE